MTMGRRDARSSEVAPRRIRAQAARWVTELHGPDRDADLEIKVRRWIEADPRHAAAFELATAAWQFSGDLPASLPPRSSASASRVAPKVRGPVLACLTLLILALMTAIYLARDPSLATGPGEQRTIVLTDGTQVSLNANSRVLVQYDARERKVTLKRGEALFNVVKHQSRPFIVVIGDRKVVALGTAFMVRREENGGRAFAVTLLEGRVAVEPISWPDALPSASTAELTLLNAGERLRVGAGTAGTIDKPSIERMTAWRRGELIFDDASLSEAVAEFNRYGPMTISIDSATAGGFRVGGVFRIGDSSSFAHAIADAHNLRVIEHGSDIVITDHRTD
jgi:transmembrane sensor